MSEMTLMTFEHENTKHQTQADQENACIHLSEKKRKKINNNNNKENRKWIRGMNTT